MEEIWGSLMTVIVGILGLIFVLTMLYLDRKSRKASTKKN